MLSPGFSNFFLGDAQLDLEAAFLRNQNSKGAKPTFLIGRLIFKQTNLGLQRLTKARAAGKHISLAIIHSHMKCLQEENG